MDQRGLAHNAKTSPSAISAYENGHKSPTVRTLDRLLAGCGLQMRVMLEPLMAHVDARVEKMLAGPVELHAAAIEHLAASLEDRLKPPSDGLAMMRLARQGAVRWALDGASALAAHGLAVEHDVPAVVVELDEALRWWLRAVGLQGQTEEGFGLAESWFTVDPERLKRSLPGPRFCMVGLLRVRVVDELPAVLQVTLEVPGDLLDPNDDDNGPRGPGRQIQVPTLSVHEVERAHPALAEVLGRWRERGQASTQSVA